MTSGDAQPLPPWLTVSTTPAPGTPTGPTPGTVSTSPTPGTVSTGPPPTLIDGRAARTRTAFFEEAARALRLPDYFGHNWDALTDSLRDAGKLSLAVEHAEELLSAEPADQLATLLAILAEAAEAGLTMTLHTDPAHEALLRRKTAAALP